MFRLARPWSSGNTAESIEKALDTMPDRYDRMAAAARELGAGDAFELELSQQFPFCRGKPSPALAVIEKVLQQDFRAGILHAEIGLKNAGCSSIHFIPQ
ncbi:MAG: hypothetical protein WCC37_00485 [Candidatus Sulfotelmatobacter sp.]